MDLKFSHSRAADMFMQFSFENSNTVANSRPGKCEPWAMTVWQASKKRQRSSILLHLRPSATWSGQKWWGTNRQRGLMQRSGEGRWEQEPASRVLILLPNLVLYISMTVSGTLKACLYLQAARPWSFALILCRVSGAWISPVCILQLLSPCHFLEVIAARAWSFHASGPALSSRYTSATQGPTKTSYTSGKLPVSQNSQ